MSLNTSTKTVQQVFDWVKRQFGDESGAQITETDILRWLNSGLGEISALAKPIQGTATVLTVIDQHTYTLPSVDTIDILSIRIDGMPISGIEFQDAEEHVLRHDPLRELRGIPRFWWRFGKELYFWPTPDAVQSIQLFYNRAAASVTAPTDVLEIPDKYFEALIQFIMSKAWELDEDMQASQQARQAFNERLGLQNEEDTRGETKFYPRMTFVED